MCSNQKYVLSTLGHTWILDLDGTLVKHNGYLEDGKDTLLSGAKEFLNSIPKDDVIIIITSRKSEYMEITKKFLHEEDIRYDSLIFDVPYGERIVVNDKKNSGMLTAMAINIERNNIEQLKIEFDSNI